MTDPIVAPLRDAAEFDLVREIAARLGANARGLGDDAAVLALPHGDECIVSVDAAVEHVHFRRDWLSPREIGYRAAAAAMSDLAAMAAEPRAILVAVTVPDAWREQVGELAEGIGELAALTRATVIGGNLSRGRDLAITTTVIGAARTPLARTGLRPGDTIYVTGRLGAPGAALAAFERGEDPGAHRARFARPVPRVREARWLAAAGAVAMTDVSDGLLADAANLAAASGVRIRLDGDRVPLVDGVAPAAAAASGEEYELLLGAREPLDRSAFERRFGIALTPIGRVEEGSPGVDAAALQRVANAPGHDHFST